MAGILLADRHALSLEGAWVLGTTALGLGVFAASRPGSRAIAAAAVAVAAGAASLSAQLDLAERFAPRQPRELTIEAEVAAAACARGLARVDLGDVVAPHAGPPAPARVRLQGPCAQPGIPGLERALPGERIRARVRLRAPRPLRNPGSPSPRRLAREGVGAVGSLVHPRLHLRLPHREGWRPLLRLHALRARLAERLAASGPGGSLLRALALGDRGALAPEVRDAFTRLGIGHLLAVSGLHLSLVAALSFAAARALLRRSAWLSARTDTRVPALALAVAAALAYALLAGWGVPVRRACVFLIAVAAGVVRGRPGTRAAPLAAAVIAVLAFDAAALFQAGAQLSFAASAALLLALRPEGLRHGRSALAEGFRTSTTAFVATAPLAAFRFGSVAPFGLAANLLAVPWTAVALLPAALVAAAAAALPDTAVTRGLLALAGGVADLSLLAAARAAELVPALAYRAPPAAPWWLGVGLLVAAALRTRSVAARAALALALAALLALAPAAAILPSPPRVVILDVGQGDAALVQGRDAAVLVDAGGMLPGDGDLGSRAVLPALAALGVEALDLVVVTHGDLDHRGGIPAVLAALPVATVWVPQGAIADPAFAAVLAASRRRGVAVVERGAGGDSLRRGDLEVTPLWPPADAAGPSRNALSLVVRVSVNGRHILLPGDIEASAEAQLLAREDPLAADLLLLPHHGSRSSSSADFLAAVNAELAVASAPCRGRYPMPHPEVVARVRSVGSSLWWTGRDGAVLIGLGDPITVWGHADAPRQSGDCMPPP